MLAIIDGDILVYRCGFAVEHGEYHVYIKGEEMYGAVAVFRYKKDIPEEYVKDTGYVIEKHIEIEPVENALQAVKTTIEAVLKEVGSTDYKIFLTGEDNFRDAVSVTRVYKGNRDALHKPRWYKEIKEYLITHWKAVVVNGIEADDAMGIEQYSNQLTCIKHDESFYGDTVICSIDKDMDMIPGWHYNFNKKLRYWIDEDVAIKNFYLQLLTGDIVDNIQGITGMGPKGAAKALDGCRTEKEYYAKALSEYTAAYGDKGEQMLKEMAQLVWIRRKEGEAWSPPV